MKNVARIIEMHGGLEALRAKPIRIEPPCSGLMRLCIEHVGTGPRGMPPRPAHIKPTVVTGLA